MTRRTLSREVHDILTEQGNHWLKEKDIADLVNERGLYQSSTGSPVTHVEIHDTWRDHKHLFERHGTGIRCREIE